MTSTALAVLAFLALQQDPAQTPAPRRVAETYGGGGYTYGGAYGTNYGYNYGSVPGYGYGTGYSAPYYNWGWGTGCRPGFIVGYPGWGSCWGGYYGGGYYGGYPGYYGGEGYHQPSYPAAGVAGPSPAPAPRQTPEAASLREIQEGQRRFRLGDYRGAVDSFRSAVVASPDSPLAQAWFAVALIAVGESRNADKALRAASAGGLAPGALSLDGLFRDDKERVRMIVALAKVTGEGSLAASYALSIAGEPVRLKQLAEKDPAAKALLPKP
jgi:hypothetical protein